MLNFFRNLDQGMLIIGLAILGLLVVYNILAEVMRHKIQIGVIAPIKGFNMMSDDKRHGVAHVVSEVGTVQHLSFVVDRPDKLPDLDARMAKDAVEQITRLGYVPTHVEFFVENKVISYDVKTNRQIYSGPVCA